MKLRILALFCLMLSTSAESIFLTEELLQDSFIGALEGEKSDRIQVRVIDQWSKGSTGASCAYHALRNGTLLALGSLFPERGYLDLLHSTEHMKERITFPDGDWRVFIIKERLKLIAQKIICEKLMKSFKGARIVSVDDDRGGMKFNDEKCKLVFEKHHPDWDVLELEKLVNAVKNISSQFEPQITEEGLYYQLNTQGLYEKMARSLAGSFNNYFSPLDQEFTITWGGKLLEGGEEMEHSYRIKRPLNGDWLEMNEEVPRLLEREKEHGMLQGTPIDTALYTGIQEPLPLESIEESMTEEQYTTYKEEYLDAQLLEDFKAIKDKVRDDEDFVGLILVYLGGDACIGKPSAGVLSWLLDSDTPEKANTTANYTNSFAKEINNGHWIPLVIIASGGKRQYIVADSMGNANRLEDPTINKVIGILEGFGEEKRSVRSAASRSKKLSSAEMTDVDQAPSVTEALRTASKKSEQRSEWSLFSLKTLLAFSGTALGSWLIWRTFFAKPQRQDTIKKSFLSKIYPW